MRHQVGIKSILEADAWLLESGRSKDAVSFVYMSIVQLILIFIEILCKTLNSYFLCKLDPLILRASELSFGRFLNVDLAGFVELINQRILSHSNRESIVSLY